MNRNRTRSAREHFRAGFCSALVALLTLATSHAQAVLGGSAATVGDDQVRMNGKRQQALAVHTQVTVHEIVTSDGSSIREYVAPNGIVFAVAWSTHFKPDLQTLLGQHLPSYEAAASAAMKTPGVKRNVVLQRDDLVVHSTAHLNTFVGKAYVRSLVPTGFNVDALH